MRVQIPFIKSDTDCPIIQFMLGNGTVGYALVDTGSETTMIDETFAKANKSCFKINITDDKIIMHGVNGNIEKPCIEASTKAAFKTIQGENVEYTIGTYVCSLANISAKDKTGKKTYHVSIVIGSDFLVNNKAKINFINSQLSLEQ